MQVSEEKKTDLVLSSGRYAALMKKCPQVETVMEMIQLVAQAQEEYIRGKAVTSTDVAAKYPKLPAEVCEGLVRTMGWKRQREEYLREIQAAAAVDFAEFLYGNRRAVAKNVIDNLGPALHKLAAELQRVMDSPDGGDSRFKTSDARRLTEAISHLAGPLMQAAAIDGKVPELPKPGEAEGDAKGKRPWLQFNSQGPVTVVAPGQAPAGEPAVDADFEEVRDT